MIRKGEENHYDMQTIEEGGVANHCDEVEQGVLSSTLPLNICVLSVYYTLFCSHHNPFSEHDFED